MINEQNIMDLSDFAERDIKEEFAHIKDSIVALEKLIEAKEKEPEDSGNNLAKKLRATIRENIEELSLPVERKCDALEAKLNTVQESINQLKSRQDSIHKLLVANIVCLGVLLFIGLYMFFAFGLKL